MTEEKKDCCSICGKCMTNPIGEGSTVFLRIEYALSNTADENGGNKEEWSKFVIEQCQPYKPGVYLFCFGCALKALGVKP